MEAEDVINLAASEDENVDILDCADGHVEADTQPIASVDKEGESRVESMELNKGNAGTDDSQFVEEINRNKDFIDDSSIMQVNVELTETVELAGKVIESGTAKHVQNVFLDVQNESPILNRIMDISSISGVKRARMEYDENEPSVLVTYKSLTRASKQKLEELLQQWSEWQAQHGASLNDQNETVESGEETYFPAICVGTKKGSAVSFWIDNQTNQQNEGFIPLDGNTTPLYDRGYALGLTLGDDSSNAEGGLKIIDDASRCFNCGSYSHSLKECPKPRDNVAVQNARQQLKSKRNQNSASRNLTRYYQNSAGGKYDGLSPGSLDAETRRLLGLGELDPPPWLNRMRELGYPPGYLDDEDQPSGITIYAHGEVKEEQEDGEIIETDTPEPRRKMSVDFPGINAPIPENADERLWAAGPSNSDPSRDRPHHRSNYHSESISRGHHHDQSWSRDSREDGRRSPLVYEDYIADGAYRQMSPPDYGIGRYENYVDRYRDDHNLGRSSRRIDEYDRHRHRSSRW